MNFDYNVEKQEITVELNTPSITLDTPTGGRGLKGDTGNTGPRGETGDTGPRGEDGYTPVKGVDYFTEEDIESLNIPTKVSDLSNDLNFIDNTVDNLTNYYTSTDTYTKTETDTLLGNKQDTLVSGTNIKTINNTSLLGSGNINIQGGGGSSTDVKINGTSITSGGEADIQTYGTYNSSTNKIATMSDLPTVPTKVSDLTNDAGYITGYTETDPVFTASAAHGISSTDISNWNAKADMGITEVTGGSIRIWGSETGMYYLPKGTLIYYAGESSMSHYEDDYGDSFLFINKRENGPFYESFWISGILYRIVTYQNSHGGLDRILNADDIKNTLTETSSYYVYALDARQGKVLKDLIDAIKDGVSIDSFGDVETALGNKQDTLVSGTNIKTINSASLLGSGDISVVATETDPVYSASAASGITSSDISNWNAKADEGIQDLPNTSKIRVWELSEGVYRVPGDKQIFYQPGTSTQLNKTSILIVNKSSNMTYYACICGSDSRVGVADGVTSYSMCNVINSGDIKNNLTTSSSYNGYVLDARQGKVLKDLIDGIKDGTSIDSFGDVETALGGKQDEITSTNKLDYSLLSNTPTIPTVPTNVSAFTNDSGYVTDAVTGDLTNLTTTNKSDLVSAVNEVNTQHIISVGLASNKNVTVSATWTHYNVNLDDVKTTLGTKLTYNSTTHRIVVGDGVSYVKISAYSLIKGIAAGTEFNVRKNGTSVITINTQPANTSVFENGAAYLLVAVQSGDYFDFTVRAGATGTLQVGGGSVTGVTFEAIS